MRRFLIISLSFLLAGCGVMPHTSEKVDSVYVTKTLTEVERDSIYIDRYHIIREKGDTVYITDTRTEWRYKDRIKEVHDTTYVSRDVEKTVEVPAEISKWQRWQMSGFWVVLGLMAIGIAIRIIRRKVL